MATKRTITSWRKQIDKRLAALGKERDELSALIDDMESLREDCDEAYQALIDANDALSKLV